VRIMTLAAGVDEGTAEGGGVLDQGQVGIATTTMMTILEIAGEQLDEDVVEDVVHEVFLRRGDEGGDEGEEEVHQQRE